MTDCIDYEALFQQLRSENEGLRMMITKMRNQTPSFFENVARWIADIFADEEYQRLIMFFSLILFISVIIPAIKSVCLILFRRSSDER